MKKDKINIIHLIDCIYLGHLNDSFQRNGFGIIQTFQFDTYVGYFRNNKAEGLGLVLFETDLIIYANFVRDQIDGLTIIDDHEILKCGIYREGEMVGVGFQYEYKQKRWKMQRYHKGIPIETVKQQVLDINQGLPKLIKIQQSLFFHLYNYRQCRFFPSENENTIHQKSGNSYFICLETEENNLNGPGILVEDGRVIEGGFYQKQLLNGYGFKKSKDYRETGKYYKGKKEGYFQQSQLLKNQQKTKFYEYHKGTAIKHIEKPQFDMINLQKRHNYNNKTFYSNKNNFPFEALKHINNVLPVFPSKKKQNKKERPLNSFKAKNQVVNSEFKEKSSRQIMKDKIKIYIKSKNKKENRVKIITNQSSPEKKVLQDDDEIAIEENPFIFE